MGINLSKTFIFQGVKVTHGVTLAFSEVFVSFCSSFLPTAFDRGVSGYVRLSVLRGLTDSLWSGGMCES